MPYTFYSILATGIRIHASSGLPQLYACTRHLSSGLRESS